MVRCKSCGADAVVADASTDDFPVCTSCGIIQSFDVFQHQPFDSAGNAFGSLVFRDYSYHDQKLSRANAAISDVTSLLGLSASRTALVSRMVHDVTDSELGEGDWFQVLIVACSHIVMRQHCLPLSISEAADAIGRDSYEVGRMVSRVRAHLRLEPLPEFDIYESLTRSLRSCRCLEGLEECKSEQIARQGRFLLSCCVKWSISTGRHPLPLVAAVLAFVTEVNGVAVSLEDIARETFAGVATTRMRKKEIEMTLVEAARVLLPWGGDVDVKNIAHNTPFLLRFMEIKSKAGALDLGTFCVRVEGDHRDADSVDACYFGTGNVDGSKGVAGSDDYEPPRVAKLSVESLSASSKKALECYTMAKQGVEFGKNNGRKRRRGRLVIDAQMGSQSKEKLSLDHIKSFNVGYDMLPPSFVSGSEAREQRRMKMKAAKVRILEIMRPSKDGSFLANKDFLTPKKGGSRRKVVVDIDWEDCVIELLLLHGVKEEEIEQGHYRRLLDLHIFNSLDANKVGNLHTLLLKAYQTIVHEDDSIY